MSTPIPVCSICGASKHWLQYNYVARGRIGTVKKYGTVAVCRNCDGPPQAVRPK